MPRRAACTKSRKDIGSSSRSRRPAPVPARPARRSRSISARGSHDEPVHTTRSSPKAVASRRYLSVSVQPWMPATSSSSHRRGPVEAERVESCPNRMARRRSRGDMPSHARAMSLSGSKAGCRHRFAARSRSSTDFPTRRGPLRTISRSLAGCSRTSSRRGERCPRSHRARARRIGSSWVHASVAWPAALARHQGFCSRSRPRSSSSRMVPCTSVPGMVRLDMAKHGGFCHIEVP